MHIRCVTRARTPASLPATAAESLNAPPALCTPTPAGRGSSGRSVRAPVGRGSQGVGEEPGQANSTPSCALSPKHSPFGTPAEHAPASGDEPTSAEQEAGLRCSQGADRNPHVAAWKAAAPSSTISSAKSVSIAITKIYTGIFIGRTGKGATGKFHGYTNPRNCSSMSA